MQQTYEVGTRRQGSDDDDDETRPKPLAGSVDLTLQVTDPEVVAELRHHAEGTPRDEFALAALRVGVLSLRVASGQIDGASIRSAGDHIVSQVRELLVTRGTELTSEIGAALRQYFDPTSGVFSQRVESLVKQDGELERVLDRHLGPEESVMARTLSAHLGEGSSLVKMLSPTDADGLRAQVERTVGEALAAQREQVVGEFSLDRKDSALSRLVAEMTDRQGKLGADLSGQIEGLVKEFSTDAEGSALNRLAKMLTETSAQIAKNLTLDDESSALARLRRELGDTLGKLNQQNVAFQEEVRQTLAEFRTRREEAERSTRHGADFENQLGELLSAAAQNVGDIFRATGNETGTIKNRKVGDHVIEMGPDSAAPGARIVWEAKEDKSYSLPEARAEIELARKNRGAQIGVFVFSSKIASDDLRPFARYGSDLVVVWDPESPATDVYVHAAFSVARALSVRQTEESAGSAQAATQVDLATRAIEKQIKYLEDFETWTKTIQSNSKKVLDRCTLMRTELARQVEVLDAQIAALRTAT